MSRERVRRYLLLVALPLVVVLAVAGALAGLAADDGALEFTDVRRQTQEFIAYDLSIELTAEQAQIKREALEALPAPCCSDNSAEVCCCPCNLSRSAWGLAKHLIVERGADAEEVRARVSEWFEFINPDGFSGDVCYTGGCGRAFGDNGCGGMNPQRVAY